MRRPRRAILVLLVAALAASTAFALVEGTDDRSEPTATPPLESALPRPQSKTMRACGSAIIADWFDNGVVDREYERGCYGAALNLLPADAETHLASAEIRRAYVAAGPRWKASTLPSSLERLCVAGSATPPCGPGASIGIDYAHVLYTHCGIESTVFDGKLWLAQPPLANGFGSPPPGWGDPTEKGIMRLLAENDAQFRNGSLVARFTPAPPGYRREDGD